MFERIKQTREFNKRLEEYRASRVRLREEISQAQANISFLNSDEAGRYISKNDEDIQDAITTIKEVEEQSRNYLLRAAEEGIDKLNQEIQDWKDNSFLAYASNFMGRDNPHNGVKIYSHQLYREYGAKPYIPSADGGFGYLPKISEIKRVAAEHGYTGEVTLEYKGNKKQMAKAISSGELDQVAGTSIYAVNISRSQTQQEKCDHKLNKLELLQEEMQASNDWLEGPIEKMRRLETRAKYASDVIHGIRREVENNINQAEEDAKQEVRNSLWQALDEVGEF